MVPMLKCGLFLAKRPPASEAYPRAEKESFERTGAARGSLRVGRTAVGETVLKDFDELARGLEQAVERYD